MARFSLEISRWSLHKSEDLYLLTYFPLPSGPGPCYHAVEAAVFFSFYNLDVTGRVFGVSGELVYAYRDAFGHWSHGYAALASLELCGRDWLDFRIDCSRFCSLVSVVVILSDNKKRCFSYYLSGCCRHHCLAY